MFAPPKMRRKNNIPADAGHFLRAEIDSTDFKNENSTTKGRQKNHITKKKKFPKYPETNETIRL